MPVRPGWPVTLQFSLQPTWTCPDGHVPLELQQELVSMLKQCALKVRAATGYLMLEPQAISRSFSRTAYEQWVCTPLDHPIELARMASGYFWGNILGQGHIEALGGLAKVLANAPCFATPFPEVDGPWVYLQLRSDINGLSDEELNELRLFLKPILPDGPRFKALDRRFRLIYDDSTPCRSDLDW